MATMYTVFTVPGIGEGFSDLPAGMLSNLTRKLPTNRYRCRQFNYRNSYGPVGRGGTTSYDENLVDAVATLVEAIRRDPNPVILVGYSAGAHVVSLLLAQLAAGKHPDLVVSGAVLVANPIRHRKDSFAPGWGIAGEHAPFPRTTWVLDVANPADIICCSEEFSPVRLFSDTSKHFSSRDPLGWAAKYGAELAAGTAQAWWNPMVRGRLRRAAEGLRRYADGSAHQRWYIESGALADAATKLQRTFSA